MKENLKNYVQALSELLEEKDLDKKKLVENFVKILIKKNLLSKADKILALAEDLLVKKKGGRKIIFEVARPLSVENRKLLENFVKKEDVVKDEINPELIAGIKIIIDQIQQLDFSLKRKLENIFKI